MRQLTFELLPRVRYRMRFPAKVRKELVRHMARAITQAAEEGGIRKKNCATSGKVTESHLNRRAIVYSGAE